VLAALIPSLNLSAMCVYWRETSTACVATRIAILCGLLL
jgi:hypothetical protein